MTDNRLPPLRLNSALSNNSSSHNEGGSNISLNARERRRQKILSQKQEDLEETPPKTPEQTDDIQTPRKKNRRGRSLPQTNQGYESDEATTTTKNKPHDDDRKLASRPPQGRKKSGARRKSNRTNNFKVQALSNSYILEGLEEDVIEMEDDENESRKSRENVGNSDRRPSDVNANAGHLKSVPTDKFYLELEKKFAIQNKELYERKEQERLRQEFAFQLKQKQKEEQKYQISTPKTALSTHKFLRKIFLFLQGINVGFQFWQIIIIFFNNSSQFSLMKPIDPIVKNNFEFNGISLLMIFLEKLTMPMHSLTYFFLTICIVDTIDRVDFTKMNLSYFVKCISFQNQFWSIILYSIALIVSLSLIFVDEPVYLLGHLRTGLNVTNGTSAIFKATINNNVEVWQYLSIVRAGFSLVAWLIFSLFISKDETYNSLEKREYSLMDEIVNDDQHSRTSRPKATSIQLSQKSLGSGLGN